MYTGYHDSVIAVRNLFGILSFVLKVALQSLQHSHQKLRNGFWAMELSKHDLSRREMCNMVWSVQCVVQTNVFVRTKSENPMKLQPSKWPSSKVIFWARLMIIWFQKIYKIWCLEWLWMSQYAIVWHRWWRPEKGPWGSWFHKCKWLAAKNLLLICQEVSFKKFRRQHR